MIHNHMSPWWLVIFGVLTIVAGLTSPYILNDGESEPTPEEKERYKATPRRRLLAVLLGLAFLIVGTVQLVR
jgi:uncharacterized membrane protein HdeD (DUF308 family)